MLQLERLGVDDLHVAQQPRWRPDLPLFLPSLAAGDKELALEDLVDERPAVGRGGAYRLEIGDGLRKDLAVETEHNAAERLGVRAGSEVEAKRPVGTEVAGAEAEIEEDAIGDDGWLWLIG